MVAATGEDNLHPGMVAVVQTAGDLANWHPHVHALVSRGGWTGDWQWVPIAYVDENAAELLYRHKVMRMLQGEGLLTEERTELLLSWRHTGFSVHNRVRVEPEDGRAVERLARYIMRPPISLERIEWRGDGEVQVLYRPKGGHDGRSRHPGDPAEAFEPAEFLARVIMHVPEPRRHLVRYYGAYSNVSRGKRRRQDKATIGAGPRDSEHAPAARADRDQSPDARALRRSWAQLIKRVYEVDPLVCPSCGGEMRIIAFIRGAISSRSTERGSSSRRFLSPFRLQPPSVQGVLVAAATGSGIGVRGCCARTSFPGRWFLPIREAAQRVGTRPGAPEQA